MRKNRFISLLLILNMLLVGCYNDDKENNYVEKIEPIQISIAFWNIDNALSGGDDDRMLQQIEKKDLNIKLVPYVITHDEYRRKIQLWASSSQLPDIVAIDAIGTPLYHLWIQKKIVKPLPDNLSRWPNLNSYMNAAEMHLLKHNDGKFYGIPRKTYDNMHSVQLSGMDRKIYYRYDLAKEAGVTNEPETYDEFRTMMKAIMDNDAENKDIGGMTVTVPSILDSFFYVI